MEEITKKELAGFALAAKILSKKRNGKAFVFKIGRKTFRAVRFNDRTFIAHITTKSIDIIGFMQGNELFKFSTTGKFTP